MANSVPFRTSPQLGPQLDDVFVGLPYWDLSGVQGTGGATVSGVTEPSYKLGNRETGNDGHDYIWVQNGTAALAASAAVTIDEDTWVATAGAGGATAPAVPVPAGAYFHARVTAL